MYVCLFVWLGKRKKFMIFLEKEMIRQREESKGNWETEELVVLLG